MQHISNQVLVEAYKQAVELDLERDFIELLRSEMKQRGLLIPPSFELLSFS
ncbi:sporulation histidine kinase inhibitor Sda [Bacillus piscicola]|uniref:sporulation histidine kinase inhibitor Sda n=1 Tax=Bacillus piscicola TaxID=1632684 RepID=UPI001F099E9B|nr:sporulation histidine kinase inhibitor Sda [Bacillus piscicola]